MTSKFGAFCWQYVPDRHRQRERRRSLPEVRGHCHTSCLHTGDLDTQSGLTQFLPKCENTFKFNKKHSDNRHKFCHFLQSFLPVSLKVKRIERKEESERVRPKLSTLRHMAVSFLITLELAGRLPAPCARWCRFLLHMPPCASKTSHWRPLKITR